MASHGAQVRSALRTNLLALARAQLLSNERAAARLSFARAAQFGASAGRESLLRIAASIPGAGLVFRTLFQLRNRLSS
jgi:hypothetical protein